MRNDRTTQTVTCLLLTAVFSAGPAMAFAGCPVTTNTVTFLGTDTTTQGAWKGAGNFNAPPASSSLIYGKEGNVLPDTESCDLGCNPVPEPLPLVHSASTRQRPATRGPSRTAPTRMCILCRALRTLWAPNRQNSANTNYFSATTPITIPLYPGPLWWVFNGGGRPANHQMVFV